MSKDYDIGYGKPPKHAQFAKGQSGNPQGRPRKVDLDIPELIAQELNEIAVAEVNGQKCKLTKKEYMALILRNKALAGDLKALKDLLKIHNQKSEGDPGATKVIYIPPKHPDEPRYIGAGEPDDQI